MDALFVLCLGLIVIIVFIAAHYWRQYEVKEATRKNLEREEWGRSKGLAMLDRPNPRHHLFSSCITGTNDHNIDPFRNIKPIPQGTCHNFQLGQIQGKEVRVFDHHYVVTTGKYSYTVEHSVVAVGVNLESPDFELRPHKFWDRIAALFGYDDHVIGSPEFDKAYYIVTKSKDFIERLLDEELQLFLMEHRSESWHCINGFLSVIVNGYQSEPQLDRMVSQAIYFANKVNKQASSPLSLTNER